MEFPGATNAINHCAQPKTVRIEGGLRKFFFATQTQLPIRILIFVPEIGFEEIREYYPQSSDHSNFSHDIPANSILSDVCFSVSQLILWCTGACNTTSGRRWSTR